MSRKHSQNGRIGWSLRIGGVVRVTGAAWAVLFATAVPVAADTRTFQQGDVNGYTGTVDAYVDVGAPGDDNSVATLLTADGPPSATDERQILIRFDNIFGSGSTQIPAGSTITSATLTVNVSNAFGTTEYVRFHRMQQTWNAPDNWNTFGASPWNATAGIQPDDVEAVAAADVTINNIPTGLQSITVTASLQAWAAAPASNFGWVLRSGTADSLAFDSSEVATQANRPKLTVQYLPPCQSNADCNDGVACTTDTCNTGTGVCSNVDNCPNGSTCDHATGACGITFQDGSGSYASTQDAHIQENAPTTNFGSALTVKWDTDEPASSGKFSYGLFRFDNIFGSGAGQIPIGSTINSATLTLYITNLGGAQANMNEVAIDWAESAVTWDTFGSVAGVQVADYAALVGSVPVGTTVNTFVDITVTSSLQSWVNNPAANRGWIILPASTDGEECASSDATTQAQHPKLTILYTPPAPCDDNLDCNDGNGCTVDACVGTVCQNTPVSCPPGETCNPLNGQCEAPPAPPDPPTDPDPPDHAPGVEVSPQLCVDVGDPNDDPLDVTFYGREVTGTPGGSFTIVVLPDPQNYAQNVPATYYAQTQWCVNNRADRNIVFVTGLGDMTNDNSEAQWAIADTALSILETAGLPFGFSLGNHDGSPSATTLYNQHFGVSRFQGKPWYGDHYGSDNDNHFMLFSASGMDFIIFHLECEMGSGYEGICSAECQAVLQWAHGLLTGTYANRRAIVVSHALMQPSGATFMTHGQAIYNALKDCPNFFLMLCGHLDQANHRVDLGTDGHPIYTLIQDYQTVNNGNGFLRIMTFDPPSDTIHVETYSPTLARFINKPTAYGDNAPNDTCARDCYVEPGGTYAAGGNELMLPYAMDAGPPWQQLGQDLDVPSGETACRTWSGLALDTPYEWYVTVADGTSTTTGPTWDFTTTSYCTVAGDCEDNNPCTNDSCVATVCQYTNNTNPCADDGNPCTDDVCSGGACTHPADDGNPCTDTNACTTDVCSAGTCQSTYAPYGGCCTASADCNDGNPGTTDTCVGVPGGDCSNVLNQSCYTSAECNDSDSCTADACVGNANVSALNFDGTNDYVTMGQAPGLNAAMFTIETWFKRTGTGIGNTTGTGGIASLVPLVTKGAPEADGSNVDANYVLGINTAGNVLAADFEDSATGLNHPVSGTTPIVNNTWYHAAATYDGTTWRLYLNGNSEATLVVGAFTPRSDSIQHAGLGAMLTSTGSRLGAFGGVLDEIRIWNVPRTQAEIVAGMNQEITSGTGLVGRWGLNENTGTTANDSAAPAQNGTLTESATAPVTPANGPTWSGSDKAPIGPGICQHTPIPGCCDADGDCGDGLACTSDRCVSGQCQNTPVVCPDDGDVCNGPEACNPATGLCVSGPPAANGTSCADATLCNGAETCQSGTCLAGTPLVCADANPCTDDSCNPGTGCVHTNNTAPCADDGNPCTDDVCAAGSCTHPSDDSHTCSDGFDCTGDACVAGACLSWYAPVPGCCDYNSDCNDGVTATTDTCVGGPNGTCSNVVTGSCTSAAQCNDSNVCTTDACVGVVGRSALDFDGTDDYVTMGAAAGESALGATAFTLEAWIKRDGSSWGSATATTGGGGLQNVVALIAKGRSEGDGSNIDCNYFFGIDANGRLAADFEQYPSTPWSAGQNHPACSSVQIGGSDQNWHHVAVTYDKTPGKGWRFYLDGVEVTAANGTSTTCGSVSTCTDAAVCPQNPGVDPRYDSIQHFALGVALNSTGANPGGYFGGIMDEARVWNRALTQAEIQTGMNQEIAAGTGLIGRWGLNENTGTTAYDSTAPAQNGTLTNGPVWSPTDTPFGASTPGSCMNTAIPNCSPCTAGYQCDDANACTSDSCNTSNNAAIELNGSSQYVNLGNDGNTANVNYLTNFGTSDFTIEGWFYADTVGADNTSVFRQGTQGTNPQVVVQLFTGTPPAIAASVETSVSPSQVDTATPRPTFSLGVWHHFALVVDRDSVAANQRMNLYLDGVLRESTVATSWGANPINDSILSGTRDVALLGVARSAPGSPPGTNLAAYLDGRLDEVRIWDYARTAQQIADNKNAQIVSATGLRHRWAMNEGTGTTTADTGGSPTTAATLVNTPTWLTQAAQIPTFGSNTCGHTNVADGSFCGDGGACRQNDTCASGTCTPGLPEPLGTACGSSADTACDNPDACNGAGTCLSNHEPNGTSCADSDPCNGTETCQSGTCSSGTPVNCPDDGNVCNGPETCDSGTGSCVSGPPAVTGTACSDGNLCTQTDTCNGAGICIGGSPVVCDDGKACTDDSCNPATGLCHFVNNNTNPCSDGDACTQSDACQSGVCVGSNPVTCTDDGNVCNGPEVCNPANGQCGSGPPATEGTACSDGNACTQTDECDGLGACVGSNPVDCNDGNPCTNDTCNQTTGQCQHADMAQILVDLDVEALGTPVTRQVTFVVTDCSTSTVKTIAVPVTFNQSGQGIATLTGLSSMSGKTVAISAVEGHTLRTLLPVSFVGQCSPTVSFINDYRLVAGDFHTATVPQDNFVDIVDFSILASRWNTTIDPTLSTGADATGDGVQNLADFTAIQINFFVEGDDADGCPPTLTSGDLPEGEVVEAVPLDEVGEASAIPMSLPARARASLRVSELSAENAPLARADLNGDGVIDARDIRRFARSNGIRLRPEFDARLRVLERLAAEPAPDPNVAPAAEPALNGGAR